MATFTAHIDVIEWMGSELYAYFTVETEESREELQEMAEDLGVVEFGSDGPQVVARLDAGSQATEGAGASSSASTSTASTCSMPPPATTSRTPRARPARCRSSALTEHRTGVPPSRVTVSRRRSR